MTFAIAGGVSQCLQALGGCCLGVRRRLESIAEWVAQGQAAAIAQNRLSACGSSRLARRDPKRLRGSPQRGGTQSNFVAGSSGTDVLRAFNRYLKTMASRGR